MLVFPDAAAVLPAGRARGLRYGRVSLGLMSLPRLCSVRKNPFRSPKSNLQYFSFARINGIRIVNREEASFFVNENGALWAKPPFCRFSRGIFFQSRLSLPEPIHVHEFTLKNPCCYLQPVRCRAGIWVCNYPRPLKIPKQKVPADTVMRAAGFVSVE